VGASVEYKASVARDLRKLDARPASRVLTLLEDRLGKDPAAGQALRGEFAGLFRLRVGDYRAIYSKTSTGVLVLRIAHRKDVYR
jgi:mRNA interferase RelE/StbE